jgi:hypothetical protein
MMPSHQRSAQTCQLRCLLMFALALAVPAFLLTKIWFLPLDVKLMLTHAAGASTVALDGPASLHIEYGLTVRAPEGIAPQATVSWNGIKVADVPAQRLFVADRGRLLVPVDATRQGDNELRVTVDGPPETTFEFQARVHNYYGIAPDFPRAYIVSDEAVRHARSQTSAARHVFRGFAFYLMSLGALAIVAAATRTMTTRARARAMMAAPAAALWVIAIASALSPLHVWLAPETVLIIVAASVGMVALGFWFVDHRRPALRFAAVAIVNVAILEVGLRVVNAIRPSFLFYDDSYNRYRGQPGAPFYDTRFNAAGFNDVDHQQTRPTDVARRIVAIGDSFVVGVVPYTANYLTLVERELSVEARTEVIKLGIAGTGPAEYLPMLVNEGLAYRPDVVLANVFIGNDLEESGRRWHEYSYTATLFRSLWRLRSGGAGITAAAGGAASYDDTQPTFDRERFLEIEVDRSWIYTDAARVDTAVANVVDRLRAMQEAARRSGATFAVVVIPDEAQVRQDLQAEVRRAAGAGTSPEFDRPNRVLVRALEGAQIPVLDLLPAFQRAGQSTTLYKPSDTHWNLAGNRLAAGAIVPYIRVLLSKSAADTDR